MLNTARQYIKVIILLVAGSSSIFSQPEFTRLEFSRLEFTRLEFTQQEFRQPVIPQVKFSLHSEKKISPLEKTKRAASVLPLSIGVLAAIYLINPILEYTDKKLYLGLTKEFSVGWGKIGQHRTSIEYSMIFAGNIRHYMRFSYKYDFLLTPGIKPSHMLQGTSVVSAGAGYFTDFSGRGGVFPELTYGYSIRNHKLLFYPHVKLRHTFMLNKDKPDITDISFGIILGIANPFIDVNIRRKY